MGKSVIVIKLTNNAMQQQPTQLMTPNTISHIADLAYCEHLGYSRAPTPRAASGILERTMQQSAAGGVDGSICFWRNERRECSGVSLPCDAAVWVWISSSWTGGLPMSTRAEYGGGGSVSRATAVSYGGGDWTYFDDHRSMMTELPRTYSWRLHVDEKRWISIEQKWMQQNSLMMNFFVFLFLFSSALWMFCLTSFSIFRADWWPKNDGRKKKQTENQSSFHQSTIIEMN